MVVKILGTRGNIPLKHRLHSYHSGVLIDNKFLFDIGEKTFLREKPKYIFLTHLHPDHAFFEIKKTPTSLKIPVYSPEKSEKLDDIIILKEPIVIDGYKITPVPTVHSSRRLSQGYLIEKKGEKIFYSSDMAKIAPKHLKKLSGLDLVITEASFIRRGGLVRHNKNGKIIGHTGVPDLIELFKTRTHKLLLIHFGTWLVKNPTEGAKKLEDIIPPDLIVTIGRDGMEIKI